MLEVHPDSDGIVRSADVFCNGTSSIRTLEKLIPLEVSDSISVDLASDNSSTTDRSCSWNDRQIGFSWLITEF